MLEKGPGKSRGKPDEEINALERAAVRVEGADEDDAGGGAEQVWEGRIVLRAGRERHDEGRARAAALPIHDSVVS